MIDWIKKSIPKPLKTILIKCLNANTKLICNLRNGFYEKAYGKIINKKYYVICKKDYMREGWTVWERVVLYNSIFAEQHGMIPVVDMCTYPCIYQNKKDYGKVNVWDLYYEQPCNISLQDVLNSRDYIYCNDSSNWFGYIRTRKNTVKLSEEELRTYYSKYVRLNADTKRKMDIGYHDMINNFGGGADSKLLGICLRGSDYKLFNHPVQPPIDLIINEAKDIFKKYSCDYYYVATEDSNIFQKLCNSLPKDKILSYNAGTVSEVTGAVGEIMVSKVGCEKEALEYLQILYNIDKCSCLIGGVCGKTVVAKYRKTPPYDYINIIDMHARY